MTTPAIHPSILNADQAHLADELARIAHRVDVLHAGHVVDSLRPDGPDLEARFFETVLAAEKQTR